MLVSRLRLCSRSSFIAIVAGGCAALFGQVPRVAAFEVASVRRNNSNDPPTSRFPLGPGDAYVPGDLFVASNQPLIAYLRFAYKLGQGDLLNLPAWVYTETFDIEARAQGNPTKDQMRVMMRSLLADRFKVITHTEKQTKPVFDLVPAGNRKPGPRLVTDPRDKSCPALPEAVAARLQLGSVPCGAVGPLGATQPGMGRLGGRRVTIAQIAGIMSNPFTGVDRPVVDQTGLRGTFDFSLEWSLIPDDAQPPDPNRPPAPQTTDAGPSFREALQKQLGLKLTSGSAPVDVLIIDQVRRPEEN
jgi:uncharacterized protein (TIGR03435 family)